MKNAANLPYLFCDFSNQTINRVSVDVSFDDFNIGRVTSWYGLISLCSVKTIAVCLGIVIISWLDHLKISASICRVIPVISIEYVTTLRMKTISTIVATNIVGLLNFLSSEWTLCDGSHKLLEAIVIMAIAILIIRLLDEKKANHRKSTKEKTVNSNSSAILFRYRSHDPSWPNEYNEKYVILTIPTSTVNTQRFSLLTSSTWIWASTSTTYLLRTRTWRCWCRPERWWRRSWVFLRACEDATRRPRAATPSILNRLRRRSRRASSSLVRQSPKTMRCQTTTMKKRNWSYHHWCFLRSRSNWTIDYRSRSLILTK